tara:strand:- start:1598 stop:1882 length:285 start_codon:yes stop_codon:yes gene_type:complete
MDSTLNQTKERLYQRFPHAIKIEVIDVTDVQHVQEGAKDNRAISADGIQLRICVICESFVGKSKVNQHKMIFNLIQDFLNIGKIHSVKIKTANC